MPYILWFSHFLKQYRYQPHFHHSIYQNTFVYEKTKVPETIESPQLSGCLSSGYQSRSSNNNFESTLFIRKQLFTFIVQ